MKEGNNIFASLSLLAFPSIVSAIVLVCENSNHIVNSPPRTDPITSDADECNPIEADCYQSTAICTPPSDCNRCSHFCLYLNDSLPPLGCDGKISIQGFDCQNTFVTCSYNVKYSANPHSLGNIFRYGRYIIYVWFKDATSVWRGHSEEIVLDSTGMYPPGPIYLERYLYKMEEE